MQHHARQSRPSGPTCGTGLTTATSLDRSSSFCVPRCVTPTGTGSHRDTSTLTCGGHQLVQPTGSGRGEPDVLRRRDYHIGDDAALHNVHPVGEDYLRDPSDVLVSANLTSWTREKASTARKHVQPTS